MIIYKITNKLNGKCYVGQTVQKLNRRFQAHARLTKSAISLAIKKYGKDNFSLTELGHYKTLGQLNDAESYFIEFYNCLAPNGYNLHTGGNSHKVSDETKLKQSLSHLGKKQSAETIAKKSISLTGKVKSLETRAKLSKANKGRKPSPQTIEAIIKANTGVRRSIATEFKKGQVPHNKKVA